MSLAILNDSAWIIHTSNPHERAEARSKGTLIAYTSSGEAGMSAHAFTAVRVGAVVEVLATSPVGGDERRVNATVPCFHYDTILTCMTVESVV